MSDYETLADDLKHRLRSWVAVTRSEVVPLSDAPRTQIRQICQRCHTIDRVAFSAPNELWRLVAGPHWEHAILCLVCFTELGDEKGIAWDVPELEFYPVSYVTLAMGRNIEEEIG